MIFFFQKNVPEMVEPSIDTIYGLIIWAVQLQFCLSLRGLNKLENDLEILSVLFLKHWLELIMSMNIALICIPSYPPFLK
jgi:hypothetical protein